MTGYTVHTGTSKKFTEGWDNIFEKKTSGKKKKKKAEKKTPSAKTKSKAAGTKKKKSGKR